ncbi:hypothetical protein JXA40_05710 [bacterium]|nr:hypothetical protein [candidate division CSSED10-310 bacterium]
MPVSGIWWPATERRARAIETESGVLIQVVGMDDLIDMKRAAERKKDLDDVEILRHLREASNGKNL